MVKKRYIIYAVVIVILVSGFLSLVYFYPEFLSFDKKSNTNTSNENINISLNANKTNENKNAGLATNLNISTKHGETDINKKVTYKEIEFNVLSADKKSSFESQEASENKDFIILYLDKITGKTVSEILSIVRSEVNLKSEDNEYNVKLMNIVGANSPEYASSYLVFEVNNDESDFTLNFGSGDSLKIISLSI